MSTRATAPPPGAPSQVDLRQGLARAPNLGCQVMLAGLALGIEWDIHLGYPKHASGIEWVYMGSPGKSVKSVLFLGDPPLAWQQLLSICMYLSNGNNAVLPCTTMVVIPGALLSCFFRETIRVDTQAPQIHKDNRNPFPFPKSF